MESGELTQLRSRPFKLTAMLVAMLCAAATACARAETTLSSDVLSGRVIAADTGKAVEGAYVTARWKAYFPSLGEGRVWCVKATAARTGPDGRFRIPAWSKRVDTAHSFDVELNVYRAGYEYVSPDIQQIVAESHWFSNRLEILARDLVFQLKPYAGTPEDRVKFLDRLVQGTLCELSDIAGTHAFYASAYDEAKLWPIPDVEPKPLEPFTLRAKLQWLLERSSTESDR